MNFIKKNTFLKLGYIFTNFDFCFKKKYYLRQKYVLPYQHLFKIDNLIPQKKINFKIIANKESVKIKFNFYRNNSVNDYNFIEKSYFSKNGIFYINEIFDRTVDNFSLYNQFSSNLFDLDIRIFFKSRYNIFYPGKKKMYNYTNDGKKRINNTFKYIFKFKYPSCKVSKI